MTPATGGETPGAQPDAKRFASLQARAALASFELVRAGSEFELRRWNYGRTFRTLDDIARFIESLELRP